MDPFVGGPELEQAIGSVVVLSRTGHVLLWDEDRVPPGGRPAAGTSTDGQVSVHLADLVAAADRERAEGALADLRAGRAWEGILQLSAPGGDARARTVVFTPILGKGRGSVAAVGVVLPDDALHHPAVRRAIGRHARAEMTLDAALLGIWDWDIEGGTLFWDDQVAAIHGIDPDEFPGTLDGFLSVIHPEDVGELQQRIETALETMGPFIAEFRVVRGDGSTVWVQGRGRAWPGPDGRAVRMVGIAADTTVLRDARERAARMLDHVSDGLALIDADWNFSYLNPTAARLVGRSPDDLVGRNVWEEFPESVGSVFWEQYHEAMDSQAPVSFEAFYGPLAGWYEVRAFPAPDGLAVFVQDITARRTADETRAELLAAERSARMEAEAAHRRLALLADASQLLSASLRADEVLDAFARLITEQGWADWCCAYLADDDRLYRRALRHGRPSYQSLLDLVAEAPPIPVERDMWMTRVHRTGEGEFLSDVSPELERSGNPPAVNEAIRELGTRSGMVVPLRARGIPLGVVALFRSEYDAFTPEDFEQVNELAGRLSLALLNAQLYEHQLSVTDALQQAVLPEQLPDAAGWTVAARYLAAEVGVNVGGDWYDAFPTPDGRMVVSVGDVAGHGLRASALMGLVRNAIRAITLDTPEPADVIHQLRRLLEAREGEALVTMQYGVLDLATARLRWTSAGHPPPALIRADGSVEFLEVVPASPLGAPVTGAANVVETELAPGDTVLWYSDGLVERRGEHLEAGLERLRQALVGGGGDPDELLARMLTLGDHRDDICLLLLRRDG